MWPGRSVPFAVWLLLAPAVASAQQPPHVSSSVDRTAIWIADHVTYAVDLACAPGVDVLLDDISKEKLRLTGLEIVSTDATATTDAEGRTTHHLRYVLTTYKVDVPALSIEPMTIRYYAARPGQRLQESAPAGEVRIPGAAIAFRSTLPDNPSTSVLRDGRADLVVRAASIVFSRDIKRFEALEGRAMVGAHAPLRSRRDHRARAPPDRTRQHERRRRKRDDHRGEP